MITQILDPMHRSISSAHRTDPRIEGSRTRHAKANCRFNNSDPKKKKA